ncbi:MAG TPA: YceI family protein [Nocardioidaceae bacterium]|nr:YceI family protein [Nocardioidaceae bacterium]
MGLFNRKSATSTAATHAEPVFEAATSAVADITGDYVLDATHTRIGFSARHAMVTTVRGQFNDFEGSAHIDTANPVASSAEIRIQAASIDTSNADRDGHLRSGDFLDSEAYPELVFNASAVSRKDADTFTVNGDLTIKDVTRPVSIDFDVTGSARDPFGNLRVGFEGSTTINRKDWDLTWNAALETGGVLVSDKIKLEFDVSAIAVAAQPA